jgi:probable phosphoglycerate mutase
MVAVSPLVLAQQTVAPLAAACRLAVQTLDGLREVDAGELEMQSSPTAIKRYLEVAFAWASGEDAMLPHGSRLHVVIPDIT